MALTDYAEALLLDHLIGNQATVYLGAFTAGPGETGGGSEVTAPSYARAAVPVNGTNWPPASGGTKSNGSVIEFPTAAESWGTITHIGIFDAPVGGNLLVYGALNNGKAVGAGDTPHLSAGALVLTLD